MGLLRFRRVLAVAPFLILGACAGSSDQDTATTDTAATTSPSTTVAATSTTSVAPSTAAPTTAIVTTTAAATTTTLPSEVAIEDTIMDLYANWPDDFEPPFNNHQRALTPADGDLEDMASYHGPPFTFPNGYAWIRGPERVLEFSAVEMDSADAAEAAAAAWMAGEFTEVRQATVLTDDTGWAGLSGSAPNQFGGRRCFAELAKPYGFRVHVVYMELARCAQGTDIAGQLRLITARQDAFLESSGITPTTAGAGFRDGARRYGADDALLQIATIGAIAGLPSTGTLVDIEWTASSQQGVFGTGTRSIRDVSGSRAFVEMQVDQAFEAFGLDSAAAAARLPAASGLTEAAGGFSGGHLFVGTDGNTNALVVFVQGNRRYSVHVGTDDPARSSSVALALAGAQRERLDALGFTETTTPFA